MTTHKIQNWQQALVDAITDPVELFTKLNLDPKRLPAAVMASKQFQLKVPHSFIARMKKGDISDPLLLQVLPLADELNSTAGYSKDPLQEKQFNPLPGLLHKYHGRVLLTPTGTCGINCRFCFRRHFPYDQNNPGTEGWNAIVEYIAKDASISEVILSGGDPLVLSDRLLKQFIDKLADIPHLKRIRIHTRMPIVIPERIHIEFAEILSSTRLKIIMVLHCNHPNELNSEIKNRIELLTMKKIVMLNQSVLLKGINVDADTLITLSELLFEYGVQPYYLHLLDKVEGTSHFDTSIADAKALIAEMNKRLPGYLIPKFVYESPHQFSKNAVFPGEFYTD